MKIEYKEYFKYVLEHKRNVFKTCWDRGLCLHAFTHDLSKFLPSEFIPYAKYFYGTWGVKIEKAFPNDDEPYTNGQSCLSNSYLRCKKEFDIAWELHYKRNKHHWNHWIGKDIPYKYIMQMICDWEAMALKFGDTAQEYYLKNYNKITLTDHSRLTLEIELGLNDSAFHNYGHTLKQFKEMYNERKYNDYFGWIKDKYEIDTYNTI
ncbi:MAG: DUF5662 family protein [Paraclostridium sp.]